MGRAYIKNLDGSVWCCTCGVHIAYHGVVLSTDYHAASGDAYLFSECVNVYQGKPKQERLRSGWYVIADLFCVSCGQKLGWTYLEALSDEQKYKVHRVVLEKAFIHLETFE